MMNRRKFLGTTCVACVGSVFGLTLLQSCSTSSNLLNATISGSDMIVPLADFTTTSNGKMKYKSHLIVSNNKLSHPICVYRIDENIYHAFLLKCTHQGAELQVFGDKMECPAHGSEFDINGVAQNGPATESLRSFPVTINQNQLNISLV